MHARDKPSRCPTDLSYCLPNPLSRPSYDALALPRFLFLFLRVLLFLPSHLSGGFLGGFVRLLGHLSSSCDVLGLPSGISRRVLHSLRGLTYSFLDLVRRPLSLLPHALLGLLRYLVDRVFYTVLLGELVERTL
jgi:hypothetical protein